jgi:hypothetical protein
MYERKPLTATSTPLFLFIASVSVSCWLLSWEVKDSKSERRTNTLVLADCVSRLSPLYAIKDVVYLSTSGVLRRHVLDIPVDASLLQAF